SSSFCIAASMLFRYKNHNVRASWSALAIQSCALLFRIHLENDAMQKLKTARLARGGLAAGAGVFTR
ncbi:hypothetical protein, partial [Achromobacter sp. GbtcB20]|uniref:hypothetical protein n=1 Tax=Achromobacter sp. GbtcB20 TaxID=2824765 RepID=UPI001C307EB2